MLIASGDVLRVTSCTKFLMKHPNTRRRREPRAKTGEAQAAASE